MVCGVRHVTSTATPHHRAFDVELLYVAQTERIPIAEVAVNWREIDGVSRVMSVCLCVRRVASCRLASGPPDWRTADGPRHRAHPSLLPHRCPRHVACMHALISCMHRPVVDAAHAHGVAVNVLRYNLQSISSNGSVLREHALGAGHIRVASLHSDGVAQRNRSGLREHSSYITSGHSARTLKADSARWWSLKPYRHSTCRHMLQSVSLECGH